MTSTAAPIYAFTRYTASSDPDFQAALALYARLIPTAGQTGGAEIGHWVDREGRVSARTVSYCCGFTRDGVLVGFAHWGVIAGDDETETLANLDYLALLPEARTPEALEAFLRQLTEAVQASGARRVVTEVLSDRALTRFCRIAGFQLIEAPYLQPPMGEGEPESAALMVWGHTGPLSRTRYLSWVHALYHDYYLPWHAPFLPEGDRPAYAALLTELESHLQAALPEATLPLQGQGSRRSPTV
jgi:hypothetical protein